MEKVLRGASPANLPIEQASKFELVINVKSAKSLGLAIPQSLDRRRPAPYRPSMDRRRFLRISVTGIVAAPLAAAATPAMAQEPKRFRLGAVSAGAPRSSPHWVTFARRLAELGYVEGRNLFIEFRSAEGRPERFPGVMAELVRLGVDVILPVGPEASLRAAKEATATIPIVVVAIDYDPVGRGYVGGLARPGVGNVTGLFLRQPELTAKRVEFLREVVPKVQRVAVFWDAFSIDQLEEARAVAEAAGLQLERFEFRDPPYSFDGPMKAAIRQQAGALLGLASPIFFRQRSELAEVAIRHRLPAIVPFRESAEAGVLMSYGAYLPDMLRRAAEYVDRILKGAKPADLPMEQPTKFEFVINLKTAKALGLTVPPSLLARADQVID
jgi:putative ABC transport system substrate-binding protein